MSLNTDTEMDPKEIAKQMYVAFDVGDSGMSE